MTEFRFDMLDPKPLLCDLCGDSIGVYYGEPPNPEYVIARCYSCAAVEEAEAILSERPDEADGEA